MVCLWLWLNHSGLGLVLSSACEVRVAGKDLATSHEEDLAFGHVFLLLSSKILLLVCYLATWVEEHCVLVTKLLLTVRRHNSDMIV